MRAFVLGEGERNFASAPQAEINFQGTNLRKEKKKKGGKKKGTNSSSEQPSHKPVPMLYEKK
jgi:hypothetical protein